MWRAALLVIALALPASAQDRAQTLADIQAEVGLLRGEIEGLRRELTATGSAQGTGAQGPALMRLDAIEAAMTALTAQAEALALRIDRIVADGTNRIGDIEFRLQELAGGDLAALAPTPPLGGQAPAVAAPAPTTGGAQLAVGEQADFDRAREVLGQGDFRTAEALFAAFTQTYLAGPLTQEAHFLRGEALSQLGETANAARAYLDAFSGAPDGARAPEALLKLGQALGQLGQGPEACVTLQEVGARFPGSQPAFEAQSAMAALGCR